MNSKNIKLAAFTLMVLSLAVFSSSSNVLAAGGCQKVKATENGVLNPDGSGATGVVTQGGRLNGTSQVALLTAFAPTADPYSFTFTDRFTLTTNEGVLRTNNVSLIDTANGVSTAVARIDPTASEGSFGGATGVLFLNGRFTDAATAFQVEITGEICYAK